MIANILSSMFFAVICVAPILLIVAFFDKEEIDKEEIDKEEIDD
jgi:uncharacterized membrane protein